MTTQDCVHPGICAIARLHQKFLVFSKSLAGISFNEDTGQLVLNLRYGVPLAYDSATRTNYLGIAEHRTPDRAAREFDELRKREGRPGRRLEARAKVWAPTCTARCARRVK